jgi:preprotein translocase subunit SecD
MASFSVRRFIFSSLALWIAISIIGVYFLFHLKKFVHFGVDLVGGTYITLAVQTDKALEAELAHRAHNLTNTLKEIDLTPQIKLSSSQALLVFANPEEALKAEEYLAQKGVMQGYRRTENSLRIALTGEEATNTINDAVKSNIETLERRLNPYGAGEITVVRQGEKNIVIELPDVHDTQQAKTMIGTAALLEIKPVEDIGRSEAEIRRKYGKIPDNLMIVPGKEVSLKDETGKEISKDKLYYLVPNYAEVTGRFLKDAQMDFGGGGQGLSFGSEPVVKFSFNAEGSQKFYELTASQVGRPLAIIIDNVVITAPRVNQAISGEGYITGNFTAQEARELALMLKSGAFKAPVTFEEERHIGPSLGAQSIRSGLVACIVGLLALLVFSIAVYKTAGLLAFIVLLYNILLILFAMAWVGSTLTLPSIAGMLLTVGMAIDASILIYERIKEELATGATLRKAVNAGFSGALSIILDANITHFLVALVLYKLGAGPIRGFAIAMIIGIASTLLTGLVLLKSIFNFLLDAVGIQKIRI